MHPLMRQQLPDLTDPLYRQARQHIFEIGIRIMPIHTRRLAATAIVDDATHEAVAIEVERVISGHSVVRMLDRLALTRGLPQVIRIDNGKEFCGKTMVTWAHVRGVHLRLIQPGKPNQNAYTESFNGRLRDECHNDHWFPTLLHARTEIETWRRENNEERPKKISGGLTRPSMLNS